jgi:hypothetical protein
MSIYLIFTRETLHRNDTFDLPKHHLLMSGVLLLCPFEILLRTGQERG